MNHAGAFDNPDTATLLALCMQDASLASIGLPARLGIDAAALLRTSGVNTAPCSRLAEILDDSILGDRCLLNESLCEAVVLALGDIAETALPRAPEAERLAAEFRIRVRS